MINVRWLKARLLHTKKREILSVKESVFGEDERALYLPRAFAEPQKSKREFKRKRHFRQAPAPIDFTLWQTSISFEDAPKDNVQLSCLGFLLGLLNLFENVFNLCDRGSQIASCL